MFNKESREALKEKVAEKLKQGKEAVIDMTSVVTDGVVDAASSTRESVSDFSLAGKVRDFSVKAVKLVSEIDNHLLENNSRYEVSNFKVSANLGVVAGMALDIHFAKTSGAKAISQEVSSYLVVTNPATGSVIKIPKVKIGNKAQVKVKDPNSGEILTVDVESSRVITS